MCSLIIVFEERYFWLLFKKKGSQFYGLHYLSNAILRSLVAQEDKQPYTAGCKFHYGERFDFKIS